MKNSDAQHGKITDLMRRNVNKLCRRFTTKWALLCWSLWVLLLSLHHALLKTRYFLLQLKALLLQMEMLRLERAYHALNLQQFASHLLSLMLFRSLETNPCKVAIVPGSIIIRLTIKSDLLHI